jgi:dethiobiotin synthetase
MHALKGCFVTGTDTEVGKTCVSAGLLHLLASHGLRAAGIKPVAAGVSELDGRWANEDVQALRAVANVPLSDTEVGPVQLLTPCAPHIAARLDGQVLDRKALVAHVQSIAQQADLVVVEGVGGFCVPLSADGETPRWGMDDVAADLRLPVILVVGLRLGCLNHALLSAQAIAARGLKLAGWVCNRIDPGMLHAAENITTLHQWLPAPCLGDVPRLAEPTPAAVAAALDASAVLHALGMDRTA